MKEIYLTKENKYIQRDEFQSINDPKAQGKEYVLDEAQKDMLIRYWNELLNAQNSKNIDMDETIVVKNDRRVQLMDKAGIADNAKVLSIGSGCGREVAMLRDHNYDADGLTLSEYNVKFAKWAWDINLMMCDMHFLPEISDKTYDAVVCYRTFEHSWAPIIALLEWNRILKEDGILIVEVPTIDKMGGENWHHQLCLNKEQMHLLFEKSRFEVLHCYDQKDGEPNSNRIDVICIGKAIKEKK